MSRKALINAFNQLAEAAALVAIELEAQDQPAIEPVEAAGAVPPPPAPAAAPVDQGVCPKHGTPWTPGTYGPYCKSTTDDQAWGKQKPDGKMFCKITPKNAPDYLRVHGIAA